MKKMPENGSILTIALHIRCPQCQIVSQQLHDKGGIFVAFFA